MKSCQLLFLLTLLLVCGLTYGNQEADTHYRAAYQSFDAGHFEQALAQASSALQVDSTVADYFLLRARVYFKLGKYNQTISDCYSVSRIQPRMPQVYLLRGQVALVTESYVGAVMLLGKAIESSSDATLTGEAYFLRGKANTALKRYPAALDDFKKAQQYPGSGEEIERAMTYAYMQAGQLEEATALNKQLLTQTPEDPSMYLMQAQIAQKKGDIATAEGAYEKYIGLVPEDYTAYHALACIYFDKKDGDKALMHLQHAILLEPGEPALYKTHGQVLLIQGKTEMGCNSLFKALQLGYLDKYGYDLLELYKQSCETE